MRKTPGAGSTSGRRGRIRMLVGAACGTVLLAAATMTVTDAHAHADTTLSRPVITTNQTGTHDGYFYAFWQDTGDAALTLGPHGHYSARWSGVNNWFGGKGWATGGRRTFDYCGTFHPGGDSYLALLGFTREPYIEYYILENWGSYRPTGTRMGAVVSADGTYDIYRVQRIGTPGSTPYHQYFSVRQQKRSGGTINTGEHFDAWARVGMDLGSTMGYMIMATEGYQSSGWSDITVESAATRPPRCTTGPPSTP
ncbi:glycoside hydrolase family 11 protein [Plantactinospora sp. BC1]|uniref:glycoside hydrolase family 11 protein n=1 Tax=Plantactinospora sp. BC1 TaxID=2108470 RepID=UPI0018FEAE4A|nr:glycoside hydrolase family 11 protein [Plantactinospora sp. BC1]